MLRKILYAVLMVAFAVVSVNAQFIVVKSDSTIVNVDGNLKITPTQGGWDIGGVDVTNVLNIQRAMLPAMLNEQAIAQYYEGIKSSSSDGSANYYFCLSDVPTSYDATGQLLPIEPGMMMCFDLYAENSADEENAIIPEGTYMATADCIAGTAGVDYTFARILNENQEVEYKLLQSGTIVVRHIEAGYEIEGNFITVEGEKFEVYYTGEIVFTNMSESAEDTLMETNVENTTFRECAITAHGGDEVYNRFSLQLFDGDCTEDGVITSGVVLNIDLFATSPEGDEIVIPDGIYTASADYQEVEEFEPFTFMAGDVFSLMGYPLHVGTYVQDLRSAEEDGFIRHGYANAGTIEFKREGEQYWIKADLTMRNGVRLTGEYPMGDVNIFDERPEVPEGDWISTLKEDKTMEFSDDIYAYAHLYPNYPASGFNEMEIIVNDHETNESFILDIILPEGVTSPVGTYSLGSLDNLQAYTFIPGYYNYAVILGTWGWLQYVDGVNDPVGQAPATEGSIEIVENSDGTFTINYTLKDDANPKHTVTASWTGEINDPRGSWKDM